ncbi:MAG TPA: hypothetical protein VGC54_12770 [Planctomycetota bacterium]
MNALLPVLILALTVFAGPQEPARTIKGRATAREQVFPRLWDAGRALPDPTAADLRDGDDRPVLDLVKTMTRMSTLEFAALPGTCPAPVPANGDGAAAPRWQRFGDLAADFAARRHDPAATRRLLRELREDHVAIWSELQTWLPELVLADKLDADDWDPDDDDRADGVAFARPWRVRSAPGRSAFWRGLDANHDVHQAVVLVFADWTDLRRVEADYARYVADGPRDLEWIRPRPEFLGNREGEPPFALLEVDFENDLPFPYGTFECHLKLLNRLDDQGRVLTEYYTDSADAYWFTGRDTYLPVRDSKQRLVGFLLVGWLGFDLDGVPDNDGDRRKTLRENLGLKKKWAERVAALRGSTADPDASTTVWPTWAATLLPR